MQWRGNKNKTTLIFSSCQDQAKGRLELNHRLWFIPVRFFSCKRQTIKGHTVEIMKFTNQNSTKPSASRTQCYTRLTVIAAPMTPCTTASPVDCTWTEWQTMLEKRVCTWWYAPPWSKGSGRGRSLPVWLCWPCSLHPEYGCQESSRCPESLETSPEASPALWCCRYPSAQPV